MLSTYRNNQNFDLFIRCIFYFSLFTLLLLTCSTCLADPPKNDPKDFVETVSAFKHFYTGIRDGIHAITTDPAFIDATNIEWKFFSAVLIIMIAVKYALSGVQFSEIFSTVLLICFTRVLMNDYDPLTTALWGWSEGMASMIQHAVLSQTDQFYGPRYIWNLITSMTVSPANFLFNPAGVLAGLIVLTVASLCCILGFFAGMWGLYGYSLAKIVGLIFVPTLLFERLSWLFDGWLRFMFGFLIYNILARANLMLVVIGIGAYFHVPNNVVPTANAFEYEFNMLTDALGMLIFFTISIIGLLSTGSFVRSIVSGSHVGSISGGVKGVQAVINRVVGFKG